MVRNKINNLHTNLLSWNFENYCNKNLVSKESDEKTSFDIFPFA